MQTYFSNNKIMAALWGRGVHSFKFLIKSTKGEQVGFLNFKIYLVGISKCKDL